MRRTRSITTALAAALLGACSAETPGWIHLARCAVPASGWRVENELDVAGGKRLRVSVEPSGVWLETRLARDDWLPSELVPNAWTAPIGYRDIGLPQAGVAPQRLVSGERVFQLLVNAQRDGTQLQQPDSFFAMGQWVTLILAEGEEPPRESLLGLFASHGKRTADGIWRVAGDRYSGEGFSIWPGEELERDIQVPPDAVLRFATCAERATVRGEAREPVRFDVTVDGESVFEHEQVVSDDGSHAWHEVALASGARRLRFSVSGSFAYTSFLAPTIGPLDATASRGADDRADLVVFLADTFRADNLAAYGGQPGITPHIDAFAEDGLFFARAWSVSTWTLPAHATMFSGALPRELGTIGLFDPLPEEVETIAELLGRSGYRTAAVTGSGLVSERCGLGQGFEWFDEHDEHDVDHTLARVRDVLDADDGRPLFLFVQTYRTHSPFEVSEATRRRLGDQLALDFEEDNDELARLLDLEADLETDAARALVDKLRRLYLGSVADLDRGFGAFLAELDRRGMRERSYVVFTSDHGEAFGEHGELYHRGRVYEEQIRVPLLIRGPGLEPAQSDHAASLVDLTPTLAQLAGLEADPRWRGRSLLGLDEERAIFAFQCAKDLERSTLAMVRGDGKLIGFESPEKVRAGEILGLYDLRHDAREDANLAGGDEPWAAALLEELTRRIDELVTPRFRSGTRVEDPERLEQLRAMGYAGDG